MRSILKFGGWAKVAAAVLMCYTVSFAQAGAPKRVLIVAANENLTDPVISKVQAELIKDGCAVSVSVNKELSDKTAKKFDAVLVVNKIIHGQKRRGVKMFLSENQQKKIVLFNVVDSNYWLSAADKTDESQKLSGSIIKDIRAVLESQALKR